MRRAAKFLRILGVGAFLAPAVAWTQSPAPLDPALQEIIDQNRQLQAQVKSTTPPRVDETLAALATAAAGR